jgi:flagellar biosynthesis/type III secretory pathway protein FliH
MKHFEKWFNTYYYDEKLEQETIAKMKSAFRAGYNEGYEEGYLKAVLNKEQPELFEGVEH